MSQNTLFLENCLRTSPVIPVLSFSHVDQALPTAEALLEGGLSVLEITLRTDAGLPAIAAISKAFPQALVGAGTILDKAQFYQVRDAGGQFCVSPGSTQTLRQAALEADMPYLPGVSSLSEMMTLREDGYRCLKLFPAETVGGHSLLKAAYSVLPDLQFCPTGGITLEKAPAYLEQPNISCVGGSWLVSPSDLTDHNWPMITQKAREAAALKS